MKTRVLILAAFFLFHLCNGQNAKVAVLKHELRWTDNVLEAEYSDLAGYH
jgi:hypothetical protein